MGITSEAIARAILVGMYRSGAIVPDQFEEVCDALLQEAAHIGFSAPGPAERIERLVMDVHHQLGLDPPKLRVDE